MKNQLFRTFTICTLLLLILSVSPAIGFNVVSPSNKIDYLDLNETNEYGKTEFWALYVASDPFDDEIGKDSILHAKIMKNVLCSNGWHEDHIKLLTGNVTKIDVFQGIKWLIDNVNESDTVLICLDDHGMKNYFCLDSTIFNKGRFWYWQLGRELNKIDCGAMVIVISACYSGSAIPFLKQKNRVIMTSSSPYDASGNFIEGFIQGLTGIADYEEGIGNKNGATSAEEAYCYLLNEEFTEPIQCDSPLIYDGYEADQIHLTYQNWTNGKIDQMTRSTLHFGSWENSAIVTGDNSEEECKVAQSFIPEFNQITMVQLFIDRVGEDDPPFTVSLRKNLTGENIATSSIKPFDLINESKSLMSFVFNDINVNPGEEYYIVCNTSKNGEYSLKEEGYNCYDFGKYYESCNGGNWETSEKIEDLLFITYGKNKNENNPPYVPRRVGGPIRGLVNTTISFTFTTEDIDGDNISYKFHDHGWIGPFKSGEKVKVNISWSDGFTYYLSVKARDEHGAESRWSETLTIEIFDNKFVLFLDKLLISFPRIYERFLECIYQ
jgi:hypothetical protein